MEHAPVERPSVKRFSYPITLLLIVVTIGTVYFLGTTIGKAFFWQDANVIVMKQQLAYYQQMVKEKSDDPQERVNLGFSYFQLGRVDEAILNYEVALQIDPGFYPAYLNLGYAYYKKKEYDEALEAFNHAARLNPGDYKAHLNLGIVFTDLNMFEQAVSSFDRAFMIRKTAADVHYYSGRLFEAMGDEEGAVTSYQEAVRFDPMYQEAKTALRRLGVDL
jgi:tetratricopeptide (TPR) repeat protein